MATSNSRDRDEEHEVHCTASCYKCGRPHDNFHHLHLKGESLDTLPPDDIVLCLPCISRLARQTSKWRQGYNNGGWMFDPWYMKQLEQDKDPETMSEAPPWLSNAIEEIFNRRPGGEDD